MNFVSSWRRSGFAGLLACLLLVTGTLTGACEARCALAGTGHGAACHGALSPSAKAHGAMPGMAAETGSEGMLHAPSMAPSQHLEPVALPGCVHHLVALQVAVLPNAGVPSPSAPVTGPAWPSAAILMAGIQARNGRAMADLPDRARWTPVGRKTTMRV